MNTILDVVAIPLDSKDSSYFTKSRYYTNENLNPDLGLNPAGELFVVGFPYDSYKYSAYPYWKRGTIANDANYSTAFLIDATTRGGMSGSPVLFRGSTIPYKFGNSTVSNLISTFLVGIYRAQDYKSEIGVVIRLERVFKKLMDISK